jgi:two-component system sensor histidine kinase UhpB
LKARIDILFGLVLLLGLAADLGRLIADARPRVQAEDEAMTRISRDFAVAALANLRDSSDPEQGLRRTLAGLDHLRHVRLGFLRAGEDESAIFSTSEPRERAPDWFANLVGVRPKFTFLPAVARDRPLGRIVIASDPTDEIFEVWTAAKNLALTGGGAVAAALLGASLLLGRTLRPLDDYGTALGRLSAGDFAARVKPAGSPEFVDIGVKINGLGQALETLRADNRELIEKLIRVQDDERRTIAHELHDEIGPHLFALRANATVLQAGLRLPGVERQAILAGAICAQVEALQGQNKRILRKLWPAALEDLGLAEALRILVRGFEATQPKVEIAMDLPESLEACGPREKLALYRLAQEALTNVFRHAHATRVEIELAYDGSRETQPAVIQPVVIHAKIRDDGVGIALDAQPGLGLTGMRERVRSLGGRFAFSGAPGGGALIEAFIPVEGR